MLPKKYAKAHINMFMMMFPESIRNMPTMSSMINCDRELKRYMTFSTYGKSA
jgi:hypothetical protein